MAKNKAGRRKVRTAKSRQAVRRGRKVVTKRRQRTAGNRKRGAVPKKPSGAASAAATVRGAVKGAVAAVTSRLPGSTIDAITLLEQDHRRLEELLSRGVDTGPRAVKARKALLDTIATALTVHETIEERLLYPALKEHPEARDIVLEGFQEHHVADLIMKELYDTPVSDEQWSAKFKVFKENIEHHIEEEEGPMFRTARGVMSRDELVTLGAEMARMKQAAEAGRL